MLDASRRSRSSSPGQRWAALFRAPLAPLPGVVPPGGRGGAHVVRGLAPGAAGAHARARARPTSACARSPAAAISRRASSRCGRRRRTSRGARRPSGGRARARARAELRLRARAARGLDPPHALGAAGDRLGRLRAGGCSTASTTPVSPSRSPSAAGRSSAAGFGVPLVVRYLLETCETTEQARATLRRLPYHLAHTLTIVDRAGDVCTAYLAPGPRRRAHDRRRRDEPPGAASSGTSTPTPRGASSGEQALERLVDRERRAPSGSSRASCSRRSLQPTATAAWARSTRSPTTSARAGRSSAGPISSGISASGCSRKGRAPYASPSNLRRSSGSP